MANKNLHKAHKAKKDEFYTQLIDIEKELKHYKDQFKGKVVYCNCLKGQETPHEHPASAGMNDSALNTTRRGVLSYNHENPSFKSFYISTSISYSLGNKVSPEVFERVC